MAVLNVGTNWQILNIEANVDWEQELPSLTDSWLTSDALSLLRQRLAPTTKAVLVEREYIDKDYRDTFAGFYAKKFARYPARTFRLHFFTDSIEEDDLFRLGEKGDQYIGFCVVRPTRVNPIGRTMLNPRRLAGVRGEMRLTKFAANVLGSEMEVCAFPFISQDTEVTVCAHAAAWMLFRHFSERYRNYAEVCPYRVAQMTTDRSHGRLIPSRGLTTYQLSEMFSAFGLHPEIYWRNPLAQGDPRLFQRLLYTYIESGIPVVACLKKGDARHAVAVFGHVSGYAQVGLDGQAVSSDTFCTHLVINDDNHMPYQLLPMRAGEHGQNISAFSVDDVDSFVVPMYEKTYLAAEFVVTLIDAILAEAEYGVGSSSPVLSQPGRVLRVLLTSSRSYKRFRAKHPIPNEVDKVYLQMPMPKFIWVCELSTRSLYPNKVLGEVLFDATATHDEARPFLAIHYPEMLLVNNRDLQPERPTQQEEEEELACFPFRVNLDDHSAYDLYRSNLETVP